MADYIDKQAALDALSAHNKVLLYIMDNCGVTEEVNKTIEIICNVPAADVKPVRHGKWLDGYGFAGNYYDCFVCDQCKKESMAKTNYCPNCGARNGEQHE